MKAELHKIRVRITERNYFGSCSESVYESNGSSGGCICMRRRPVLGFGFGGMGLRTAEQEGRNECKERTGRMLREKGRRIGFDIGGRCDDDAVSLLLSLSRAGRLQGSNGFTLASHKKYWVGGKRERSPATPPSSSATSHVFIHFGQAFIWLDGYHFLIQSVSRVRGRKLPLVVGGGGRSWYLLRWGGRPSAPLPQLV